MNSEMGANHPGSYRTIRNALTVQGEIAPSNQGRRVTTARKGTLAGHNRQKGAE